MNKTSTPAEDVGNTEVLTFRHSEPQPVKRDEGLRLCEPTGRFKGSVVNNRQFRRWVRWMLVQIAKAEKHGWDEKKDELLEQLNAYRA